MNKNKQLTKGYKMRKIAMIVSVLAILGTSAQAGYWSHQPSLWGGGYTSTYIPTYGYQGNNQWGWN